ncbi:MAG: hypothetical protein GX886_05035, partial [Comamonadaceae bacterium]|nr:hypothetical protein [Comamonadaceae bacterium]
MQRRSCLRLMLAASVGAAVPAPAAEIAGVDFVDRLRLAGTDLLLNGVGVRAVAWFKGYAAALYLTGRARSADEVVAQPGPKRLRLVMLMGAPASEFIKAFDKGVKRNVAEDQVAALEPRMAQFDAMLEGIGQVVRNGVAAIANFSLTPIPFFILMGELLLHSGVA